MQKKAHGIVPVMLTPLTDNNQIDLDGLGRLVDWYVDNGADALFAVCQSSEMQRLTLDERVELARRTVDYTRGRVPVIASGHISDEFGAQREELKAIADTGVDAMIFVTSHLDPTNSGTEAFRAGLDLAMGSVPGDMPLGLYECPAPYRRLLSDDEFRLCRDTGRFVTLKDVSCDIETIRRRVAMARELDFAVVNANAAIAAEAMRAGGKGFAGVFTNIHPDLYAWLYRNRDADSDLRRRLEVFLALAAMAEPMGYPGLAKVYHKRLGTFGSAHSRVTDFDIAERYWAVMALLEHIETGTAQFRAEIADSGPVMTILNVGSINRDRILRVPHFPAPGETLQANSAEVGPGGKGLNQTVAIARAGGAVRHIGAIGADDQQLRAILSDLGVDTTHIAGVANYETGSATILVDDQGENLIVLDPGANRRIPDDVVATAIYASAPGDWLLIQNETNQAGDCARLARASRMRVALSAAPFVAEVVVPLLGTVDLLSVNAVELQQLVETLGGREKLPDDLALLITRGAEGAEYVAGGQSLRVAAHHVPVVDTTGAGDVFLGVFLAEVDRGRPVAAALAFASAAAAVQVTRAGAVGAIPTRSEAEAQLRACG